jgi:hypothetical protein
MIVHILTVWYIVQLSDHFKEIDMGRSYRIHVRMRNAYIDLYIESERKRTPGCSWKDTVMTDFK